jgi:hypothetical protein
MRDGFRQFAGTVVAVDALTQRVARRQIAPRSRAEGAAARQEVNRWTLQHNERFANVEAKLGVKRHGAVMKSGLHEPHAGEAALTGAVHDSDH